MAVESKILHRQPGYAEVWARIGNAGADNPDLSIPLLPDGYYLSVQQTGRWQLGYTVDGERHRLAAGHTPLPPGRWHTIKIVARGTELHAVIDGTKVATATDDRYARGRVGIGTGWNRVQFDDFTVG